MAIAAKAMGKPLYGMLQPLSNAVGWPKLTLCAPCPVQRRSTFAALAESFKFTRLL